MDHGDFVKVILKHIIIFSLIRKREPSMRSVVLLTCFFPVFNFYLAEETGKNERGS